MSARTLFIHIPKNAGTSIADSCRVIPVSERYLHPDKIKESRMNPRSYYTLPSSIPTSPQGFIKHAPYNYVCPTQLRRFDRSVAVVRNPWSRAVSLYNHGIRIGPSTSGTWYYKDKISWNDFILNIDKFRMDTSYFWKHPFEQWASQLDWVTKFGKVKVDILRFENIEEDIKSYFGENTNLKSHNIGPVVNDYRELYTKEQKQKVADWFRMDIEYWGFDFDSGATRNYWRSEDV